MFALGMFVGWVLSTLIVKYMFNRYLKILIQEIKAGRPIQLGSKHVVLFKSVQIYDANEFK